MTLDFYIQNPYNTIQYHAFGKSLGHRECTTQYIPALGGVRVLNAAILLSSIYPKGCIIARL